MLATRRSPNTFPLRTQVNITETAATNLAADSVLVADTEILYARQLQPCRRQRRLGGVARTIVVMIAGGQPKGGWPAVEVGGCKRGVEVCSRAAVVVRVRFRLCGCTGQLKRLCQQGGE